MFKKIAKHKKIFIPFLAFFLGLILFSQLTKSDTVDPEPTPLAEMMKEIREYDKDPEIKEIKLDDAQRLMTIKYEDETIAPKESSYTSDYGIEILNAAGEAKIEVNIENTFGVSQGIWIRLISLLPILILILILVWFLRSSMGGSSSSKEISEIPDARFSDLGGVDEAVEDLGEITDFLNDSERFRLVGAKPPRGALLYGPPGTGKTALARAVAGEAGVPFFYASGADFVELFVGMGARRVRNLFKAAKKHDRALIFIDELDAIGGQRSGSDNSDSREHNRTINALLTEMDGFEKSNVIVLAATNNPDGLDSALTRAGRFDRKISVDLPDWKGRKNILAIHSKGKPLADDVDLKVLSKSTSGLSGAELENLVNEALINAVRFGRSAAAHEDFMEALSIVTIGRAKKSAVITERDKQITAWHESGHAVVALALEDIPDPSHCTILPRGMSGGHTKLQEGENKFQTAKGLKARLAMMMGGLAAERLMLNDITQGPGSDLQQATNLAKSMVAKMGMGSSLLVHTDQALSMNVDGDSAVNKQIETLISDAVDKAVEILDKPQWRRVFDKMSERLMEEETLESDDIQELKKLGLG